MIIKSVKLKNIRSYRSEEIEIPAGTVLLAGDIGSGKTTILLAIEFALFGISTELSGEALLNHAASEGFVELCFELGGKDYTIRRSLKRKADRVRQEAGYVIADGERTELTATELKAFVLKLIGYPDEMVSNRKSIIFRYTVYTPQEEMRKIIGEGAETRLVTLRKIFNIDKYKLARENASIVARSLRQEAKEIEAGIVDLPKVEEEIGQYKEQLEFKRGKLHSFSKSIEQSQKGIVELKACIEKIEAKRKEETELRKREQALLERLESDKAMIEKERQVLLKNKERAAEIERRFKALGEIKEVESIEAFEKTLAEKEAELQRLRREEAEHSVRFESVSKEVTQIEAELGRLSPRLDGLKRLAEKALGLKTCREQHLLLQKVIEETRGVIEKAKLEQQQLITKAGEHEIVLENLEAAKTCPVCRAPLTPQHRLEISNERAGQLKLLEGQQQNIKMRILQLAEKLQIEEKEQDLLREKVEQLGRMEGELSGLENIRQDFEKKQMHLDDCRVQLSKLAKMKLDANRIINVEQEFSTLREHHSQLKTMELRQQQRGELSEEHEALKKENQQLKGELEKLLAQKSRNEWELDELRTQLSAAPNIEEEYSSKKKELDTAQAEERRLSLLKAALEAEMGQLNEYLTKLKTRAAEMKNRRLKLDESAGLARWLDEFFAPLTESIERHVMLNIYHEFNELFVKWFTLLIDDPDLTVRLDEEFSPIVVQNGFETTPELLSGGERTSLALAYRLALNRVINDIAATINTKDLIILDEPTEGFSSEQLDNVRKVLEELNTRQVIIVSHESKIESFVENVIYIGKHENGSSVLRNSKAAP